MSRHAALYLALTLGIPLLAQAPASPTTTLTAGTQLVVVDVIVQDHDGHPVHGLKSSDFKIEENKTPQSLKTFDEHIALDPSKIKPQPPLRLPPGTFTDYTPVPEDATLNVLLLDTLNTPMSDQAYVRSQLQQYVKQAKPGTRIAIFGLTSRLIFLQGFTSDPDILKNVVERKLIPRASALLDDPSGANTDPLSLSDTMAQAGASASAIAGVKQIEADTSSFQIQFRTRYTLDAFNELAHYLDTFPGRKNVMWFSGSFPLAIFPDPTLDDPFAVQADFSDELRETTAQLDRARIAVYPIDARGLQANPVMSASRSGNGYATNPGKFAADSAAFYQANAQEHMTMDQIADDTGGHAFYNTNGLADAVAKSIDAGSNYYTLTYSPSNHDAKGEYRKIRVDLQGAWADRGLKLAYRRGYYTISPSTKASIAKSSDPKTTPATKTPAATPVAPPFSLVRAAMKRGAPAPSEILFKVLVLPDSTTTDDKIAPKNQADPNRPMQGPYRLYDVTFAVLASDIALPLQPDGQRHGALEFLTYVYDTDGKLLNIDTESAELLLKPELYQSMLKSGVGFKLQVSAPAHTDTFLRIAVHDLVSNRIGAVEVPTAIVSHLPPMPTPPAATPATPPASK